MPKLCAHHLGATTILIVLLACINTQAAQVVSLYSADIVVDSQSNTTYQKALPEALTNALIKASGNPSINSIDQIQNKLKQPEAFVQSYQYDHTYLNGKDKLVLHISFVPSAIKQLLRQSGQGFWPEKRPSTLLWLIIHSDKQISKIISTSDILNNSIMQTSSQRGIPIILPIMDIQDQQPPQPINEFDLNATLEQAKRYMTENVLVGLIDITHPNKINAKWHFKSPQNQLEWEGSYKSLNESFDMIINHLADHIASQSSHLDDQGLASVINLEIGNIRSYTDYAQLFNYLANTNIVTDIEPVSIHNAFVLFKLSCTGSIDSLTSILQKSAHFELNLNTPLFSNTSLSYIWQPSLSKHVT